MSIEQMRAVVLQAGSTKDWAEKVRKMPDTQVVAIYNRILNKNRDQGK
mgnify:FL=1